MRRIALLVIIAFLLLSCNNSRTVNSKDLAGRYSVDLVGTINNATDSVDDEFAKSFINMLALGIDIDIVFYDNNKGILEFKGWTMDFLRSLEDIPQVIPFDYKIKNDSILQFINNEEESDCIVRKLADNYDYLQLVFKEDNGEEFVLNLAKTIENQEK